MIIRMDGVIPIRANLNIGMKIYKDKHALNTHTLRYLSNSRYEFW
jgi:hypothetical protein